MSDKSLKDRLLDQVELAQINGIMNLPDLRALAVQVGELAESNVSAAGLRVLDAVRIEALEGALRALTQGSTIRVYGCSYMTENGERRSSIAMTDEQRKLVAALNPEDTDP